MEHSLGKAIQAVRKSRKMTQKELSELIKVEESTVSRYECGQTTPSLVIFRAIVTALNTSADFLLGISDVEPRQIAVSRFHMLEHLTEIRDSVEGLINVVRYSEESRNKHY